MSYISKPKVSHPGLEKNKLGLRQRDYEGTISTLCAGCGHDSISAALIQTFFELSIDPYRVAKTSGIGCSSKTPAYFLGQSHAFNSVHGRMPSVTMGANAANRSLLYVGISGDGDSLSIGMGQFCHAIRRNVNMAYIIENNGVYGLTKGQFSATADIGSTAKKGEVNNQKPIDAALTAINQGAGYVARGFSGDRDQLVPLLKGALLHQGIALVDIVSPCVTFNDHEGSTKSYAHTREHYHALQQTDFVAPAEEITVSSEGRELTPVTLHDGSRILLRNVEKGYDPRDQASAFAYLKNCQLRGEIPTGLLYVEENSVDFHERNNTIDAPLNSLSHEDVCPGSDALKSILSRYS
jgi:2-oxoglutarate ferredoxin oxidoreductase subunit beta